MEPNLATAQQPLTRRSTSDRSFLVRQWLWLIRFARRKPLAAVSGVIVALLLLVGIFADVVAPYPHDIGVLAERSQGSSLSHPMGTNPNGRDVLSRVIYGARVSTIVGFGTILISQVLATAFGVISGYFGGAIDTLFQRLVDIGQAFPGLVFIITLVAIFGSTMIVIIISLGLVLAFGSSRVIRGAALATRQNQYVEAAQALGAGHARILWHHILPNVFPVIIVGATVLLGSAILIEASLSFLGYGVTDPPSWGYLLNEARPRMTSDPYLAIWPGLAVFLAVYAFNMLGDGLRDVLDPRLRGSR